MGTKALLIIDVQEYMFQSEKHSIYKADELLLNIQALIKKAHSVDATIIYVNHTGLPGSCNAKDSDGWQTHHLLKPKAEDIVIHKYTPDSFVGTNLNEILKEKNTTELVICGLQTEYCIDTTCRRAFSLGYRNYLVKDANSTYDLIHLSAEQIIEHHHRIMADWFANIILTNEVSF